MKHLYDQYRNMKDTSEKYHMEVIDHLRTRISFEMFRKSDEEKALTKTRMYAYPNKNHCPVPPNN